MTDIVTNKRQTWHLLRLTSSLTTINTIPGGIHFLSLAWMNLPQIFLSTVPAWDNVPM